MSKLLFLALVSDLLTPILIWKAGLPAEFRWLSHAALALMIIGGYIRLLRQRHVPKGIWLVVMFSILGVANAWLNGQSVAATLWGSWLMLRYPIVGLYVYLQPHQSARLARLLHFGTLALLGIEVVVQVGQYLTGETPGDNLAGTFGVHGTAHLVTFVMLVLALSLGQWIARGKLGQLLVATGLGVVSSVLGEMKLFFFAAAVMGALALLVYVKRNGHLRLILPYALILAGGVVVFPSIYDALVPQSSIAPFSDYLNPDVLERYLTSVQYVGGGYDVGRNYMLRYTWHRIASSPVTLLLGEGLGARGESKTLGSAGMALLQGDLGLVTGSSLVVIMGELGLAGLTVVAGLAWWVVKVLWQATAAHPVSDLAGLQYGLLLYTLMFPLWLWYTTSWTLPVPMLIYWASLAFVLRWQVSPTLAHESIVEPAPHLVGISKWRTQ